MKRMALATVTSVIAMVSVALIAAGCSGTPLDTTASPATARMAAANPCAAKAAQPSAANPCAAKTLAAAAKQPCAANPCATKTNPCAAKNPCAANPCAAKNPCAAGAKIEPTLITRPAGTKLAMADRAALITQGERLWQDLSLSTNGLTCQTCHINHGSFLATFSQPYPHTVAMAKERAGMEKIDIDEMVQLCMVVPMAAKPLPWNSRELAALSAYSLEVQKTFKPSAQPAAANPCAVKNPCAPQANPCAPKGKNPCSANPCAPRR
jgi:cytochrome c